MCIHKYSQRCRKISLYVSRSSPVVQVYSYMYYFPIYFVYFIYFYGPPSAGQHFQHIYIYNVIFIYEITFIEYIYIYYRFFIFGIFIYRRRARWKCLPCEILISELYIQPRRQLKMPRPDILNPAAAAADFWFLLSTNISLIPQFRFQISATTAADF